MRAIRSAGATSIGLANREAVAPVGSACDAVIGEALAWAGVRPGRSSLNLHNEISGTARVLPLTGRCVLETISFASHTSGHTLTSTNTVRR
jgi:hypothetical protein